MPKILLTCALLVILRFTGIAQRLHARQSVTLLRESKNTGNVHIAQYKRHYFVAWTERHLPSTIEVSYLGSDHDTLTAHADRVNTPSKIASSPQFCSTPKAIYLLWATENNQLNYCQSTSDTGFNQTTIKLLDLSVNIDLTKGFGTAALAKGIAVAGIDKKDALLIALTQQDSSGVLSYTSTTTLDIAQTSVAPSATMIDENNLRCCWTDRKDHQLCFADLNLINKSWSPVSKISEAVSGTPPIVLRPFNDQRIFYFWKANNNTVKYIQELNKQRSAPQLLDFGLPDIRGLSVSPVDHNNFLMACTGGGKGFQLNYFSRYNPTTWINDIFYPNKAHYRLGNIVIPGAHDAGMSVLNGVGGRDKRYVNRCNTLTQLLNVDAQLKAGIRMFDIRLGVFNGTLYTKHAPAVCMEESKGGGWGEKLDDILNATKSFLDSNQNEFVILNFSHFCEHPLSIRDQASQIAAKLGENYIYDLKGINLADARLNDIAGKVVLLFENNSFPDLKVSSSTTSVQSSSAVNFKREYAKTNNLKNLIAKQQAFFTNIAGAQKLHSNDLIRLDWQLTERSSEAALVCNVFRVERYMPIVDGLVWLTNTLERNKSILNLSVHGNKSLIPQMNLWMNKQIISRNNKPNILYVDAAGSWITDYCVELNQNILYGN